MNNKNNNKTQKTKSNDNKLIKSTDALNVGNIISKKKLRISLIIIFILMILLIFRLFYLQLIDGSHLSELASKQQTTSEVISSKRGNIYDSTGASLAISETVDTITINPKKIKGKTTEETTKLKEKVAKGLSEIFSLDYSETLEKVNSDASVKKIVSKVEESKVNELKTWMKDNKITTGINIDEDSKRYYPYGTLASNLIGVCGNDNQGLSGIEASYDSLLTGTAGKLTTSTDAKQSEIPNSELSFIPAQNGYNIALTIDLKIQNIVEKYLKQAVETYSCNNGGNCIVMNPSTGEILAMASYPNYDLNSPFTPTSYYANDWDNLSDSDKTKRIYEMWKVRSVSETYEPGSVFKLITASIALEEGITGTDISGDFFCSGTETVSGTPIKCWRYYNPHQGESLRDAIMNSCNPAFIQLSKRIGATTIYKYLEAYGLFDKTNIGLSGESAGIFYPLNKVGSVELATMSFGQRFTITPLQMITSIASIANGGNLMQPRIIKSMTNTDTGEITYTTPTTVRQVLSSETAEKVRSMMESAVEHGTCKTAKVQGYSVGGKSGTSEPTSGNKDAGYVASFAAISPVENSQVVLLLTLYAPEGKTYFGGQTAGPVVSQMLSEILPHLGLEPNQN